MYKDNSLIPTEAVRLAALGILTEGSKSYAGLADEVRHFTGRIVGPSLDLIGPPIELLRVEGLIETVDGADRMGITEAGRIELLRLLGANLRGPLGEFNKLVIALKLRFLHLLDHDGQRLQAELLAEICERELVRLTDLRRQYHGQSNHLANHLVDWLDHDIAQVEARLAWFLALQRRL